MFEQLLQRVQENISTIRAIDYQALFFQSQVKITSETEVGLKFNIDAKKGLSLYISDYL